MRTLILFTCLALNLMSAIQAQEIDTTKFPELDPYVGTWVGSEGRDSLVITIEKVREYFEPLDIYTDRLVGKHYFYRNGNLISDNFNTSDFTLINGSFQINEITGKSYLDFRFKDLRRNKRGDLKLFFVDESKKVVEWKLGNTPGIRVKQLLPKNFNKFSVPKYMTLRKIN